MNPADELRRGWAEVWTHRADRCTLGRPQLQIAVNQLNPASLPVTVPQAVSRYSDPLKHRQIQIIERLGLTLTCRPA